MNYQNFQPLYNANLYNAKLDLTWSDLRSHFVGSMTVHLPQNGMKSTTDQSNLSNLNMFVIHTFINWSIYLLPSSEKHALFLADEYHQSNMAVTVCTILQKDSIFHIKTEIYV